MRPKTVRYFAPSEEKDLEYVKRHMQEAYKGRYASTVKVRTYQRGKALQWYDSGCYWPEEPPEDSPFAPPRVTL